MKRLLAYLFIILGLGLTFSVKANAKNSYVEGICILDGDKYLEEYLVRLNTKRYSCKLSNVIRESSNPKQYKNLKSLIPKKIWSCMVKTNNKSGESCSKGLFVRVNRNIILSSTKGTDFYNKLTKIAKAEPSQTEKKKVRKRIDLQLYFCEGAFYNAYLKDYNNGNCEYGKKISYQKFKEKRLIGEGTFDLYYIQSEKPKHQISTLRSCSGLYSNKGDICNKIKYQSGKFYSYGVFDVSDQTQIANKNSDKLKKERQKLAEEKRKIEEEKRKKAAAKKKKEEEEQKRIAEAKKKEEEEQKYRILVKKYGDDCKDNSLGSPEFNKCLKDVEAEDLLQAKLQREFLASLTPEEARAYTCNNTFGFRKGSSNFKDCIFKLYTTELELEKLDLEKQLALAKVEAEKAKADTARAQVEIIQARSAAARAEGKLQEAQIQATKAQTLSMQQQAAASRQQAAAAQAQARAAQQQNSLNLMTQGLKMLSGNQSSTRLRTNCSWSSIGISCR